MDKQGSDGEQYSDEDAARRATEALRRSLASPHKTQKEMVGKVGRAKAPRGRRPAKSSPKGL
jgi:hypothetical protein